MAAVAGYNSSFLVTSQPSVAFTNEASTDDGTHTIYTITNSTKRYFDKSVAVVVQQANDELQSITITGSPTGGTFTLTFGAQTTSALAYNATAAQVQTALQALSSIGANNALVTGGPGPGTAFQVQFTAALGQAGQALITANGAGLTGGSSPGVSIARVQAGQAFTTISTGFTLYWVNGRVVYNVSQPIGTYVRFASGNYFPYSTLGNAHSAEFDGKMEMADVTVFNTTGTKSFIPTLISGELKCSEWWANETMVTNLTSRSLLVVSFVTPTGARYEGFAYEGDCNLKANIKDALDEELVFTLTDQFFAN